MALTWTKIISKQLTCVFVDHGLLRKNEGDEVENIFLLSKGIGDTKMIDVISPEKNLFGDLVTSTYNLRPCLYLNSNLDIISGDGSEKSPFVVGENNG